MRIELEGDTFVATCQFEQRHIFKARGWTFDASRRKWITHDLKKAIPHYEFAVGEARSVIERWADEQEAVVAESFAADSDIEIPLPVDDGIARISPRTGLPLEPMPFQKAGVAYGLKRKYTLIADPPGLGKTIQAVLTSNALPSVRRVLIICPAFLKVNWRREWNLWCSKGLKVGVAVSKTKTRTEKGVIVDRWTEDIWPADCEVAIINPEQLPIFDAHVKAIEWDLFIVDECHYYCNPKTIRSKYIYGGTITKEA